MYFGTLGILAHWVICHVTVDLIYYYGINATPLFSLIISFKLATLNMHVFAICPNIIMPNLLLQNFACETCLGIIYS